MALHWPWRWGAANANPQLQQKTAQGLVALQFDSQARWSQGGYAGLSRQGFMRNPVAYRCVRQLAEAAAAIPWLVYEDDREMTRHPLAELLERPHRGADRSSFFETLYGHMLISGNAYVERLQAAGGAGELHVLRPDRVRIVADENGWPAALDYQAGARKRSIPLDEGRGLHLRLFHPLDDHYGFAPLEAALMALDIHNAAGGWNKALLDNSARPSGALVYAPGEGRTLSEDQFERLKTELEEGYSGAAKAGRPLLLEGGLDWKSMGLSPLDMDFIAAKNTASREIALAFGVPPMLLGIPGDNTYANYAEANRAFYRLSVIPLVTRTSKAFSQWLGRSFGAAVRLEPDLDRVEGLSQEREALWQRMAAADFLDEDEKREAVGYSPRAKPNDRRP
ncbi:phage portal protein [Phyllobacterium sp. 0TCS1.6C]|uniref:phage portal protein n=1 Tax=unclassified Phyllobacterium TaxID=2638441 RepID=UPI0022644323|nr:MULTISPECIES: phage portal protein [unclassified Phyllobacterium]MCX8281273.1 phage portal protein [Phyllobacterium sp. 0TCS1.6C]MCX8296071.1 phage portal protein [Phyllobacterium sp. 0TCS1.6A]